MRKSIIMLFLVVLSGVSLLSGVSASTDIVGYWKFCNDSAGGGCKDTYYFTIEEFLGATTIVDECSKNGPAISNVAVNGSKITFSWVYLDINARYAGTFADGEMRGYAGNGKNWTWTAKRLKKSPTRDQCNEYHTLKVPG